MVKYARLVAQADDAAVTNSANGFVRSLHKLQGQTHNRFMLK